MSLLLLFAPGLGAAISNVDISVRLVPVAWQIIDEDSAWVVSLPSKADK